MANPPIRTWAVASALAILRWTPCVEATATGGTNGGRGSLDPSRRLGATRALSLGPYGEVEALAVPGNLGTFEMAEAAAEASAKQAANLAAAAKAQEAAEKEASTMARVVAEVTQRQAADSAAAAKTQLHAQEEALATAHVIAGMKAKAEKAIKAAHAAALAGEGHKAGRGKNAEAAAADIAKLVNGALAGAIAEAFNDSAAKVAPPRDPRTRVDSGPAATAEPVDEGDRSIAVGQPAEGGATMAMATEPRTEQRKAPLVRRASSESPDGNVVPLAAPSQNALAGADDLAQTQGTKVFVRWSPGDLFGGGRRRRGKTDPPATPAPTEKPPGGPCRFDSNGVMYAYDEEEMKKCREEHGMEGELKDPIAAAIKRMEEEAERKAKEEAEKNRKEKASPMSSVAGSATSWVR